MLGCICCWTGCRRLCYFWIKRSYMKSNKPQVAEMYTRAVRVSFKSESQYNRDVKGFVESFFLEGSVTVINGKACSLMLPVILDQFKGFFRASTDLVTLLIYPPHYICRPWKIELCIYEAQSPRILRMILWCFH